MRYLNRIAFNSHGWRYPTGEARNLEDVKSYVHIHGFGHEEWIFRNEWLIDGWRYAFTQGVNKGRKRLSGNRVPFDLILFTLQPPGHPLKRRYIARIRDVECLDTTDSKAALDHFTDAGWLDQMKKEIEKVKGNVK
jgi:hypothetical protein